MPEAKSEDPATAQERGRSHPVGVLKPGGQGGVSQEAGEPNCALVTAEV